MSDINNVLEKYGQLHIMNNVKSLSAEQKDSFFAEIEDIDWHIFDILKDKEKEAERGKIEPLGALEIPEINARHDEFYASGIEAIKKGEVAAVLLAGGMGTRLGMDGPKGTCQVGINRSLFIFEQLINNLLDVTNAAGAYVPLYIMTSDKNDEATRDFFAEHDYFGYPSDDIFFFKQAMAPAVDFEGKLLLEAKGKLATSPNGNGGWFASMEKTGALADAKKRGVKWFNCFAVDNVLQRIADPVFVGATILGGFDSAGKVVKKADAYEKVGVLCLEDGRPSIVEYYEMGKEMAESLDENGELAYRFGVILNYLFSVDKLEEIVKDHMPLHIVEKKVPYIDENEKLVSPEEPNGYKFETLILDMVHKMDRCLSFEVVREKEFAPIKNLHGVDSLDSARELLKLNGVEL